MSGAMISGNIPSPGDSVNGAAANEQPLSGKITESAPIYGNVTQDVILSGDVANETPLCGSLQSDLVVVGDIAAGNKVAPYEGDYEVTPQVEGQELKTKHLYMTEDVTIHAIPFFEVSNTSGGNTVYIANEIEFE